MPTYADRWYDLDQFITICFNEDMEELYPGKTQRDSATNAVADFFRTQPLSQVKQVRIELRALLTEATSEEELEHAVNGMGGWAADFSPWRPWLQSVLKQFDDFLGYESPPPPPQLKPPPPLNPPIPRPINSGRSFLIGSILMVVVGLGVWAIANRSSATLPSQTSSQPIEPTKTVTPPPPPTHAVSEVRHALKYTSRDPAAYVFEGIAYSIGAILYDDNHTFVQIIAKGLSDGAMSAYHPNISFDFWMKPWVEHNFIIDSSGNRYSLIPALVEYQGHIDHDQIPLAKGEITRFILAYKNLRLDTPSVTVHFTACRNCPERTETVDILHQSRGSITPPAESTEILVAPDNPRCADRARLRSKPGVTEQTFILFINSSDEVRKVWWRDQNGDERNDKGERQPYKTLGPGESYTQPTYPGHIWVITDAANKCVQVAVGIEVIRQIQIRR